MKSEADNTSALTSNEGHLIAGYILPRDHADEQMLLGSALPHPALGCRTHSQREPEEEQ